MRHPRGDPGEACVVGGLAVSSSLAVAAAAQVDW